MPHSKPHTTLFSSNELVQPRKIIYIYIYIREQTTELVTIAHYVLNKAITDKFRTVEISGNLFANKIKTS